MINIYRQDEKIIGIYDVLITPIEIRDVPCIKSHLEWRLIQELKKEENSGLFTYKILNTSKDINLDFFGDKYIVTFEFVPNQELIEELKIVSERLEVGL